MSDKEHLASETLRIAITELEAVEREIGIPSKALPLLRAMQSPETALTKATYVFAGKAKGSFLLKMWFESQEDLDAAFAVVDGSAEFVPMEGPPHD